MVCPYLIEQLLATPVVLNRMQATCRPALRAPHRALLLALTAALSRVPNRNRCSRLGEVVHTGGGNV
jgi:hypothetical protein